MTNLNELGKEFDAPPFTKDECQSDPIKQFETWFNEASQKETEANGMVLATVNDKGIPRARVVLLKYFDSNGLVFFTNYDSRKGQDITHNQNVSVNFWWRNCQRQVIISGRVKKLDAKHSDDYFHSRPRESQIAASISPQSQPIQSYAYLREQFDNYQKKNEKTKELVRPNNWGGYIIEPIEYEFWQGRPCRLHDRFAYTKNKDGWNIKRLAP